MPLSLHIEKDQNPSEVIFDGFARVDLNGALSLTVSTSEGERLGSLLDGACISAIVLIEEEEKPNEYRKLRQEVAEDESDFVEQVLFPSALRFNEVMLNVPATLNLGVTATMKVEEVRGLERVPNKSFWGS